jgi:hypothetical protein
LSSGDRTRRIPSALHTALDALIARWQDPWRRQHGLKSVAGLLLAPMGVFKTAGIALLAAIMGIANKADTG